MKTPRRSNDDRHHLGMRIVEIRKFPDGWQLVKVMLGGSFVSFEWIPRYRRG